MTRWSVGGFRRDRMRQAREAAGLSRQDVAVILDCAASTVRGWEDGTATPHGPYLKNLAEALGLKLEDLVAEASGEHLTLGDLRARAGLLQADAAIALGLSVPTLSETERGNRTVQPDRAAALARLYAVPVEQVLLAAQTTRELRRQRALEKARASSVQPPS